MQSAIDGQPEASDHSQDIEQCVVMRRRAVGMRAKAEFARSELIYIYAAVQASKKPGYIWRKQGTFATYKSQHHTHLV